MWIRVENRPFPVPRRKPCRMLSGPVVNVAIPLFPFLPADSIKFSRFSLRTVCTQKLALWIDFIGHLGYTETVSSLNHAQSGAGKRPDPNEIVEVMNNVGKCYRNAAEGT